VRKNCRATSLSRWDNLQWVCREVSGALGTSVTAEVIRGVVEASWPFVRDFGRLDMKTAGECDTSKCATMTCAIFWCAIIGFFSGCK
jgi:hypothetical protein